LVLKRLVDEAILRRDQTMELEVFDRNTAALRLYERAGFVRFDRLLGFEKATANATPVAAPSWNSLPLSALPADAGNDDALPWQLRSPSLLQMPEPWQLVHDGDGAYAIVDLLTDTAVLLRLLYIAPEARGRGQARPLLSAIERYAAGRPIRAAQLVPSALGPFAEGLGFRPMELFQWRMKLNLAAG